MKVLILGRPNVGKSSLFNAILGKRIAITANESGTTRDTIKYKIPETNIDIVDGAGLEDALVKGSEIEKKMYEHLKKEIDDCDLILFCVDSRDGLTYLDKDVTKILYRLNKEVFVVLTKCDNYNKAKQILPEVLSLGFGDHIFMTSSAQNNVFDLEEAIKKYAKENFSGDENEVLEDDDFEDITDFEEVDEKSLEERFSMKIPKFPTICLLGRPNVGKSSIMNAILNYERSIVSDTPHTTRDVVEGSLSYDNFKFNILDTAGFRRPGRVEMGIEKMAVERSVNMMKSADVTVLVFDLSEGITHRDKRLVEIASEESRALVIVANKWDLLKVENRKPTEEEANEIVRSIRNEFKYVSWCDIIMASATDKRHMHSILLKSKTAFENSCRYIKTSELNRIAKYVNMKIPGGKILYTMQCDIRPVWFKIWVNKRDLFDHSYTKAFENEIRRHYDFHGVPIHISVIERERKDYSKINPRQPKKHPRK